MYKALTTFTDLQDNNYKYHPGDEFPRNGLKVSKERFEELLSDKNRRHKPVIEEVVEEEVKEEQVTPIEEESEAPVEEPKPTPNRRGRKKANAE